MCIKEGDTYRSCVDIPVLTRSPIDTAAILIDYDECFAAVLPANELFTVIGTSDEAPEEVLCMPQRQRALAEALMPIHRHRSQLTRWIIGDERGDYDLIVKKATILENCCKVDTSDPGR